jgi:hypothetical protein
MKTNILHATIFVLLIIASIALNAQSWSLTGNSGTSPRTNFLGTKDNKALALRTDNIERMRVSSTGLVGIGNSPSHAELEIKGSVGAAVAMFGIGETGVAIEANNPEIGFNYYYNGATRTIKAGYASVIGMDAGTGNIYISNCNGNKSSSNFGTITGFQTVVTINQAGHVGIGTSTPGAPLAVVANATKTDIYAIYAVGDALGPAIDGEGGSNVGVAGNGEDGAGVAGTSVNAPGISASSDNNFAGYFDGDVYATGTYGSSDQNLKQNIRDFSSGMDIINELKPKLFEFRRDGDYKLMHLPQGTHYGLIAQDVEDVLPDLVKDAKFETRYALPHEDAKNSRTIEFKALNYTEFIPVIIKALQEQDQIIESQQKQIQAQQKTNEYLQKQIDDLKAIVQTQKTSVAVN